MRTIIHVGVVQADDVNATGWMVNADAELVSLNHYKVTPETPLVAFWGTETHYYLFDTNAQAKTLLSAAGYE